jgi:hypothetical protein
MVGKLVSHVKGRAPLVEGLSIECDVLACLYRVIENLLITRKKCSGPVPVLCWKAIQEVTCTPLSWRTRLKSPTPNPLPTNSVLFPNCRAVNSELRQVNRDFSLNLYVCEHGKQLPFLFPVT